MSEIVVVGAGQAGAALVAKLRALGHEGGVTLVGAEEALPYQRPPLSKAYLMGELTQERLQLRPRSFYDENGITLELGAPVTDIDRDARTVSLGERTIRYDQLALTTGARPRRLPATIGGDLSGVHEVRTLRDIDGMTPAFAPGQKVLIVGGGYIGLEAAAVAAKKGLDVTLVEAAPRILQRVASQETADWFRALHQRHGVKIREGTGLERITGEDRATGAVLSDGTELAADFVIVGIGVDPGSALAERAGLELDNGIAVDELGRTSDPAIWAAGDCTSFPWRGHRVRLESVPNAIEQGEAVAANMLGQNLPYDPHPWFWSDQYDVKLQIAGLNAGYDRVVVRPADRGEGVSHWYYDGETLLAVDAMNDPRAFMTAKRLLAAGRSPAPDAVGDPGTDLKSLAS